jgi:hypothetical protein
LAGSGCDVGDPSYQPIDAPSPQLLVVRATTALDANGEPERTPLSGDGSTQVLSTASLILDRFLLPSTAIRQSVCLWSDLTVGVQTFEDCQNVPDAARVFLEPTYNPLEREVIFRRAPDQPRLAPGATYRLAVLAPAGEGGYGIRAFDGAPLERTVTVDFTIAAQDPAGATDETPPLSELWCRRDPACLAMCTDDGCRSQCAVKGFGLKPYVDTCSLGAGCHSTPPGGGAAMGLDLQTGERIQLTAVGQVAHQTQTGEHAEDPDQSPRRFGRAMPIIDPTNPGNSYLLYKIAVGPNARDPNLPPGEAAALAAEIQRLRASVVAGMPMPPAATASFWLHTPPPDVPAPEILPRVDGGDLDVLTAWIAQGAPTHSCLGPPFE